MGHHLREKLRQVQNLTNSVLHIGLKADQKGFKERLNAPNTKKVKCVLLDL